MKFATIEAGTPSNCSGWNPLYSDTPGSKFPAFKREEKSQPNIDGTPDIAMSDRM